MKNDVLIKSTNISKKFSKNLKSSLHYGAMDMLGEIIPPIRRKSKSSLRKNEFWSVNDVSFEVRRGECLGLIGRNGAGKTTILKMINGLIRPDRGRIEIKGRVGGLIALGAGFNPILTGRENLYINASVLGLLRHEIDEKYEQIVDFAELKDYMDMPVQNYSSGMAVRLGFSIAANIDADVVLLDEVFAVGDLKFRAKSYDRIDQIRKKSAVIIVTHNLQHLGQIASRAILLDKGKTLYDGSVVDAREHYARSISETKNNNDHTVYFDPIKMMATKMLSKEINYNENLLVQVHLESTSDLSGYFHLQIFDEQTGHLGAESSPLMGKHAKINIRKGSNTYQLTLFNLCLRGGRFSLGFQLRSQENRMLAVSKYALYFEMKNKVPVSSTYQLRSEVKPIDN